MPAKKAYIEFADLGRGGKPVDYDLIGKVSTESVFKHTGKHWRQWIPLLEKAGAASWSYHDTVAFLAKKHKLTPWWQHGVALGFEIAQGRRKTGQDAKGHYMVTATKSLRCSAAQAWKIIASREGIATWLKPLDSELELKPKAQFETTDGFFGEIRTVAKARRVRMYWQDPLWEKHTVLELMLAAPSPGKVVLVFNHTALRDTRSQASLRIRWKSICEEIQILINKNIPIQ